MPKVFNRALKIAGELKYIGGVKYNVIEYDMDNLILRARVAGVPADSLAGFGIASIVQDTTNGDLYRNEGSTTSTTFVLIADGDQGDTGVTGDTGVQGDTGEQGPQGDTGAS